ncbi:MAG: AlkZ family DNA glycosylase [Anaerolineales bacterium]|nr:AlkZ family DNA glycosylase [Anaerolineales bacterium]
MDAIHTRLFNQGLISTKFHTIGEVVSALGAVQAQDYAGAKWALGLRLKDSTDSSIDQALADGSILRTHLLRPTWHFVSPTDIRWLLMLTAPRVHAVNAFMARKLEVDKPTLKKSYAVLEKSLQGNQYLTRTDIGYALEKSGVKKADGQRLVYIMMAAELDALICSGPREGKQFTYALLDERVPKVPEMKREEALAELTKRYFSARGPATLQDFTWWSGLTLTDARNGIEMVKSHLTSETINNQAYWFAETKSPTSKRSETAHLLPNYDEFIVGYTDRSFIYNTTHDKKLDDRGNVLFQNTIAVNGQIKGTWKRTVKKNEVLVELTPFIKFSKAEVQAVATATKKYGDFLGLPVRTTGVDA